MGKMNLKNILLEPTLMNRNHWHQWYSGTVHLKHKRRYFEVWEPNNIGAL